MKTKVSQKEWNDKRDAFLCALYANPWRKDVGQNLLRIAEKTTSELYEVEEIKETPMPQFIKEDWQRWNKLIRATPEQLREWFPQAYKNEGGEK